MRLGIDARDAFAATPRGTGKTLAALLEHMLPLAGDAEIALYTTPGVRRAVAPPARLRPIDMPGDRFEAWDRVRLPLAALVDRLDLLHCPSQMVPALAPCPVVFTVHDLIPLRIADGWSSARRAQFGRSLERSVRRARQIIAVSEFTRQDLIASFPAAAAKTEVVPWGITPRPAIAADAVEEHGRAVGVDRPYFVAFGGRAPRKNVARVLEALAIFVRTVTADVQLVLAGVHDHARALHEATTEGLGMAKHTVLLPYVADVVVDALVAGAQALVYPSLYEGFGLPILEAMALGTPVITSNVTSMPEVAGDAALLVDPTDAGEIADAMRRCYLDGALRADLRRRGAQRVAAHPWPRTAARTLDVYRRALGGGR